MTRTQSLRCSHSQLFICYGGNKLGDRLQTSAVAWVVDTISQAYDSQDLPAPGNLVAHSTRSMATSWAVLRGVSVAEICAAASWSTPCMFSQSQRGCSNTTELTGTFCRTGDLRETGRSFVPRKLVGMGHPRCKDRGDGLSEVEIVFKLFT